MKVIPVIDLKNGQVVHARRGQREDYQPWQDSRLCSSTDVLEVIQAFLTFYPFDTFYIADLDAITFNQRQTQLIEKILGQFPGISFWVDAGFPLAPSLLSGFKNFLPVLGSESFDEHNYFEIEKLQTDFILSLDHLNSRQLGAKSIFTRQALWPQKVILMVLDKVGSELGPDFLMVKQMVHNYPVKTFIAAGGVRNRNDLEQLKALGITQVLVATALHNGQLNAMDMQSLD